MPLFDLNFTGIIFGGEYTSLLTFDIAVERIGVNAAPSAVWFECTNLAGAQAAGPVGAEIYDRRFHEVVYHWDFGDPDNAVPTTDLNIPARWKNQNEGRGRRVAHCYDDHGEFTAKCYAYEPATKRFGFKQVTLTVGDPAVVFPAGQTIVCDPNDTADVSHLTNPNVQSTYAGAIAARKAMPTLPARILIANDATLEFGASDTNTVADDMANMRMGALQPTGRKPVFRTRNFSPGRNLFRDWNDDCVEMLFYGLEFDGEWDSTTETGKVVRPFSILKTAAAVDHLFGLHKCVVSGVEQVIGIISQPTAIKAYSMFSDTKVTNWQNYGITPGSGAGRTSYVAAIGCAVTQDQNALSGGAKSNTTKDRIYNNHGPYRDFGSTHSYLAASDFFSRTGWSVGGVIETVAEGDIRATAVQPALRVNTNGVPGMEFYADRVKVEGHVEVKEIPGSSINPGNYVLDRVLQLLPRQDVWDGALMIHHGGSTSRNVLSVRLNTPQFTSTTSTTSQFVFKNNSANPDNAPAGWRVAHCTMLDLRNDANTGTMATVNHQTPLFTNFTAENNLVHRPALSAAVPVTGHTINLGQVLDGVICRDKGPRYGFLFQTGTLAVAVPVDGTVTIPYSQITDMPYNHNKFDNGTATTQAYWQANPSTDNKHLFIVSDLGYHSIWGEIIVSFGASGVVITNKSGVTWASGSTWRMQLDRTSRVPVFSSTHDATALDLDVTVNATDTTTTTAPATAGIRPYDDLVATVRTTANNKRGALV